MVFLLVLELTCRIEDWVTYGTPIISRVGSLEDLVVRDADGMHARPLAEFQKWKINSLGMRGPERPATPAPGTIRVVTVGASETFGLRESPNKEYPRQLEDSLTAWTHRGGCGRATNTFEVLNAAFAGMSLPTIDQDVRLRLHRLQPDIVVVYPSSVQYLQDEIPRAARPDSAARPASLSLSRAWQPRVLARLREQIKQTLPGIVRNLLRRRALATELRSHPPHWQFNTLPARRLALFDEDLRHLLGTIRGIGAEPVLVTHANLFMDRRINDREMLVAWEKFYPRATGPVLIDFDAAARTVTMRAAADSGVVSVDAARRLAAAPASVFGDFVHFTDQGASIMADAVRNGVLAVAADQGLCQVVRRNSGDSDGTARVGGRD